MVWTIRFEKTAEKALAKLDRHTQRKIQDYIDNRLVTCSDPRDLGKALRHDKSGLWRYRVDKYRIICKIEDQVLVIVVLQIGKRDSVYET